MLPGKLLLLPAAAVWSRNGLLLLASPHAGSQLLLGDITLCAHRVIVEVMCALVLLEYAVEAGQLIRAKHIARLAHSHLGPAAAQHTLSETGMHARLGGRDVEQKLEDAWPRN